MNHSFTPFSPGRQAGAGAQETGPFLQADGISKSYGELAVLSHFSLFVPPSGRCCLMSPSGSGKTTLFRILLGLETPDSGKISVPSRIGTVFQENRLIERLSPVENVRLVLPPSPKAECLGSISAALSEILPVSSLSRPVYTLSGGMKRRCAVARAVLFPSDALIMDEPFAGLDGETKRQVISFILKRQKNRPLLLSTHSREDAALLGAETAVLYTEPGPFLRQKPEDGGGETAL